MFPWRNISPGALTPTGRFLVFAESWREGALGGPSLCLASCQLPGDRCWYSLDGGFQISRLPLPLGVRGQILARKSLSPPGIPDNQWSPALPENLYHGQRSWHVKFTSQHPWLSVTRGETEVRKGVTCPHSLGSWAQTWACQPRGQASVLAVWLTLSEPSLGTGSRFGPPPGQLRANRGCECRV